MYSSHVMCLKKCCSFIIVVGLHLSQYCSFTITVGDPFNCIDSLNKVEEKCFKVKQFYVYYEHNGDHKSAKLQTC